jgi:exonuclease III
MTFSLSGISPAANVGLRQLSRLVKQNARDALSRKGTRRAIPDAAHGRDFGRSHLPSKKHTTALPRRMGAVSFAIFLGQGDNVQVAVGVWNVRHGGGRRRPRIARASSQLDVDVLVLAEWSPNGSPPLRGLLEREGWNVVEAPGIIASRNYGVAVACRSSVRAGHLTATDSTRLAHAVVDVGGCELDVLGVYVPSGSPDMARKRALLDELAQLTEQWPATRPAVLAGDFNCDHRDATGALSPRLVGEPRFAALFDAGWHDAHRRVAGPSASTFWEPRTGVGFRIDHILFRGPVHPLTSVVRTTVEEGHLVAGPDGNDDPMSDHAAITTSFAVDDSAIGDVGLMERVAPNP